MLAVKQLSSNQARKTKHCIAADKSVLVVLLQQTSTQGINGDFWDFHKKGGK